MACTINSASVCYERSVVGDYRRVMIFVHDVCTTFSFAKIRFFSIHPPKKMLKFTSFFILLSLLSKVRGVKCCVVFYFFSNNPEKSCIFAKDYSYTIL